MTTTERSLSDDIYFLGDLLGEVIQSQAGADAFALEEHVRALGKDFRSGDLEAGPKLGALIQGVSVFDAEMLIRAFTNYFQLVNLAEDNERVRRIYRRERETPTAPRRGSIAEAILILRDRGVAAEEMQAMLNRASIKLVLTAHPTHQGGRPWVTVVACPAETATATRGWRGCGSWFRSAARSWGWTWPMSGRPRW